MNKGHWPISCGEQSQLHSVVEYNNTWTLNQINKPTNNSSFCLVFTSKFTHSLIRYHFSFANGMNILSITIVTYSSYVVYSVFSLSGLLGPIWYRPYWCCPLSHMIQTLLVLSSVTYDTDPIGVVLCNIYSPCSVQVAFAFTHHYVL